MNRDPPAALLHWKYGYGTVGHTRETHLSKGEIEVKEGVGGFRELLVGAFLADVALEEA